MSERFDGGTEQYEDAICPGCGSVLTGSREPGDRDYCQDAEREVTLAPANRNYRAHRPTDNDGPQPFGPEHLGVKGAIERHREANRVPVEMRLNDPSLGVVP